MSNEPLYQVSDEPLGITVFGCIDNLLNSPALHSYTTDQLSKLFYDQLSL